MTDDTPEIPDEMPESKPASVPKKKPVSKSPANKEASPELGEPTQTSGDAEERAPKAESDSEESTAGIAEPPGGDSQGGVGKRRRRRRRKGGGPEDEEPAEIPQSKPRPKLDAKEVERKAWKIYLSEVGEEGLALINDNDARELSRRSFRIAEIFIEEAARRQ